MNSLVFDPLCHRCGVSSPVCVHYDKSAVPTGTLVRWICPRARCGAENHQDGGAFVNYGRGFCPDDSVEGEVLDSLVAVPTEDQGPDIAEEV